MTRATGVGGIFLRAADPEKLHAWYEEHLGVKRTPDGAFAFFSEGPREMTVFAFFPKDTDYFGPGKQEAMVNLRVDDLDAVLEKLRATGADIDPSVRTTITGASPGLATRRATVWNSGSPPGFPRPRKASHSWEAFYFRAC